MSVGSVATSLDRRLEVGLKESEPHLARQLALAFYGAARGCRRALAGGARPLTGWTVHRRIRPMRKKKKKKTLRGSPQAIEKRIVGRMFNEVIGGGRAKLDGRTEKRRRRLLAELGAGTPHGARALKPLQVLMHVTELIAIGESVAAIKKVRKPPRPMPESRETVALVKRLNAAYAFPVASYRFVGVGVETLKRAGLGKD